MSKYGSLKKIYFKLFYICFLTSEKFHTESIFSDLPETNLLFPKVGEISFSPEMYIFPWCLGRNLMDWTPSFQTAKVKKNEEKNPSLPDVKAEMFAHYVSSFCSLDLQTAQWKMIWK